MAPLPARGLPDSRFLLFPTSVLDGSVSLGRPGHGSLAPSGRGPLSLQGVSAGTVEITTTAAKKSPTPRIKLHRVTSMAESHVAVHRGVPVTSVARTIVDLASVVPAEKLEKAFNHALRFQMTTSAEVGITLAALGSQGRAGARALGKLIAAREALHESSASEAEDDFISFVRWARLPEPVGQLPIFDSEGRFVMRCDFAYPDVRVAIEVDSQTFHSDAGDRARDHAKRRRATSSGWLVVPVTRRDMGPDRRRLARDLRTILAHQGARGRSEGL